VILKNIPKKLKTLRLDETKCSNLRNTSKGVAMKLIILLMLVVGAAVCSIASPTRSWQDNPWDSWREEARQARQQAREAREDARRAGEQARREARQATEEARRVAREVRRDAFENKLQMRREERQFLREMRRQKLEVEREVRDAFRYR
jgi:hypothetical protein